MNKYLNENEDVRETLKVSQDRSSSPKCDKLANETVHEQT
jgi:hypothetical protein